MTQDGAAAGQLKAAKWDRCWRGPGWSKNSVLGFMG
jgi:hypothetical protein